MEDDMEDDVEDASPPGEWDDLADVMDAAQNGGGGSDAEDTDEAPGDHSELPDAPKLPAARGYVVRDQHAAVESDSDEEGQARDAERTRVLTEDRVRLHRCSACLSRSGDPGAQARQQGEMGMPAQIGPRWHPSARSGGPAWGRKSALC